MLQSQPSSVNTASNTSGSPLTAAERQRTIREKGLKLKQLPESALAALPQRKLYIVLWIRDDPPVANYFHWGLYYHNNRNGGTKYHMRGLVGGWIADHGSTAGVFKSQFLGVLIEIGSIPEDEEATLDQIMRSHDSDAKNIPRFTCQV